MKSFINDFELIVIVSVSTSQVNKDLLTYAKEYN